MKKQKERQAEFAPVTFSEEDGVRYLHFGSWWVQGAMRIDRPNYLELEYSQQLMAGLLFLDPKDPRLNTKSQQFQFLQLGLGTGALTKYCQAHFPKTHVTAIDLNPSVILAARVMFHLPEPSQHLEILQGDALEYVTSKKYRKSADLLQVDLYDASAQGPVLSSEEFYEGCYKTLKDVGVMTVNLFGRHKSFKKNINHICDAFHNRVLVFPEVHDCNVVVMAFKGPKISVDLQTLQKRADQLHQHYELAAKNWPEKLIQANINQKSGLKI